MKTLLKEVYGSLLDSFSEVQEKENLPVYLAQKRKLYKVSIMNISFMIVYFEDKKDFSMDMIKKQMIKYEEIFDCPIVLGFENLITYQRKSLIEKGMPFIAKNGQIFLPFLGSLFLKCCEKEYQNTVECFMPVTQLLFLLLLYSDDNRIFSKIHASKILSVSPMSVTRAVRELTALNIVGEKKAGKIIYIYRNKDKNEFYNNALNYLINPILKKTVMKESECKMDKYIAGETALTSRSDLISSGKKQYAVYKKENHINDTVQDSGFIYWDDAIEIQEWKYDPALYSINGMIDPVSLIMSFKNEKDERILSSLEDIEKEILNWKITV